MYVGGIRFYKPVLVGSVIEAEARLIYTGRTSMHVAVDIRAGDPKDQDFAPTTHCVIVFVAVDEEGRSTPVPPWTPATEEEISEHGYAIQLMEVRSRIEEKIGNSTVLKGRLSTPTLREGGTSGRGTS